jgi:hypothetical protein
MTCRQRRSFERMRVHEQLTAFDVMPAARRTSSASVASAANMDA